MRKIKKRVLSYIFIVFILATLLTACGNTDESFTKVTENEMVSKNSEEKQEVAEDPKETKETITDDQMDDESNDITDDGTDDQTNNTDVDPSNPYYAWNGEWFSASGETITFYANDENDMVYEFYLADGSEYYCGDFEGLEGEASVKFGTSLGAASSSLFTFDGDMLTVEQWYPNALTYEDVYEGAITFYRVGTHSEIDVVADPSSSTYAPAPEKTEINIGSEYDGYYILSSIDLTSQEVDGCLLYYISSTDYGEDSYFVGVIYATYNRDADTWNTKGEYDLKNDGSVTYAEGNTVRAQMHFANYIGYTHDELVFNGDNLNVTTTMIDGTVVVEDYVKLNSTVNF